jgi:hypothetical protein
MKHHRFTSSCLSDQPTLPNETIELLDQLIDLPRSTAATGSSPPTTTSSPCQNSAELSPIIKISKNQQKIKPQRITMLRLLTLIFYYSSFVILAACCTLSLGKISTILLPGPFGILS